MHTENSWKVPPLCLNHLTYIVQFVVSKLFPLLLPLPDNEIPSCLHALTLAANDYHLG